MKLQTISIQTRQFYDIIDLTEKVEDFLINIAAKSGLVNVFTRHTTIAIKINEKEDGFFQDLKDILFDKVANLKFDYKHNDTHVRDPQTICPVSEGHDCLNGHSHVAQMFIGSASETIPVENGKLLLGTWQRILMFEMDRERKREVVLSFVGECK